MMFKDFLQTSLPTHFESGIIRFDESMKLHTTFEIGGPADVFCTPRTFHELVQIISFCQQHHFPYLLIGKGSNLLISDKGIRACVISTERLTKLSRYQDKIYAFCGITLKELCDFAASQALSGLEFACGIPGSLGGAVYMNAGAYEGEMAQVVHSSLVYAPDNIDSSVYQKLNNADHKFAYRNSSLQQTGLIHLASELALREDDPKAILERMQELDALRESKQPLDLPSAGSVFKRPVGHFTGKLIDDCGLRGFQIGGAKISDKHCGFIVNVGNATAEDVQKLISHVQDVIAKSYGVKLETEIRLLGEK